MMPMKMTFGTKLLKVLQDKVEVESNINMLMAMHQDHQVVEEDLLLIKKAQENIEDFSNY